MQCPYCQAKMTEMNHGVCPACKAYCGCSFNPTSSNDYCNYHNPFKRKENDQKIFEEVNKKEGLKRNNRDNPYWHHSYQYRLWAWNAALEWERERVK